jgi:hypothetical protein
LNAKNTLSPLCTARTSTVDSPLPPKFSPCCVWIVTGRALPHNASSSTPSSFGSPSTLVMTSVSRVAQSVAATAAVTTTPTPAAISSGFG